MANVAQGGYEDAYRDEGMVFQTTAAKQPTAEQQAQAAEMARWNDQRPIWDSKTGSYTWVAETNPETLRRNNEWRMSQKTATTPSGNAPPIPTDPMAGRDASPPLPTAPVDPLAAARDRLSRLSGAAAPSLIPAGSTGTVRATTPNGSSFRPAYAPSAMAAASPSGAQSSTPTIEGGPSTVDRSRIDPLLSNLNEIGSQLMAMGLNDQSVSAALAQLQMGLQKAQENALSIARSGNRRDRAANERLATFEQARMASETQQQSALVRAEEERADRQLRMDAYTRAGELGLNAAALELDTQRINIDAATNYLNNLFADRQLGLQLDQAEAERVTNFVRDMALIQADYAKLDAAERASIRQDLTARYGISEQARIALEQLDAQPGFWEQAALGLIGGAGSGATAGLFSLLK